jgi:LCP family protein required for cell wall assembly
MAGRRRHPADPDVAGTRSGAATDAPTDTSIDGPTDTSTDASTDASTKPAAHPAARRRRILVRIGAGAAVVVLLVVGITVAAVLHLKGNIHAVDVSRGLGTDRPGAAAADIDGHTPLNVLVIGSDSRDGANGFVGGKADEGRSDTALVLHLSADRRRAVAVSIPRDSVVPMPSCLDRQGQDKPGAERQFNDAYTIGGAACTQRTVEQLTGLRIDHYVVIDFAGFKDMVDALGTVSICLPKAVNDTQHHIELPAGRSQVNGTQALAYVRERYLLGDGGDLGRIGRQQAFISSVLQEATSAGTLTDPPKLYAFLQAATRSVTMDPDLAGLGSLTSLAKQVSDIGLKNIQFVTVPNEPYQPDPNRLQWAPSARALWTALRNDAPITFTAASPSGSTSAAPGSSAAPSGSSGSSGSSAVDPADVRVRVLNASGIAGQARTAADQLRTAGWNVVEVGDADATDQSRTRILYGTGTAASARAAALSAVIPNAELVSTPGLGSTLQLEVGTDWAGLRATPSTSSGAVPGAPGVPVVIAGAQSRTADTDICSS